MAGTTQGDVTTARRFSVALLGGLRLGGRLRLSDRLCRVTLIGGMDLDLTEATFTAGRVTIVKVSLIGGIEVRVPAAARVEVHGFAIGGRRIDGGASGPGGPTIVIHAYGLLGGVKVYRRAP